MSAPSTPSVLLIGGPDAGKSNFLFRFWLAVDSEKCALIKNGFPDELQYLRTGSESLLSGHFAGRTSGDVLEHASIPVKLARDPNLVGVLNVPDVPGEKILEVYRLRQWSDEWETRIDRDCGCLIFVRAGSTETVSPLDYDACKKAFGSELKAISRSAGGEAIRAESFSSEPELSSTNEARDSQSSESAPTDVVLTDWLQFLRAAFTSRVGGSYRPRVGVIVAAWDALPSDQQDADPFDYLAENFSLLAQFIETNGDRFNFQVFGLSILDGDLKEDAEFRLRFIDGQTHDFGYVRHALSGKVVKELDVTIPVAWALGWRKASNSQETI